MFPHVPSSRNVKVQIKLFNYATRTQFKGATGIDTFTL